MTEKENRQYANFLTSPSLFSGDPETSEIHKIIKKAATSLLSQACIIETLRGSERNLLVAIYCDKYYRLFIVVIPHPRDVLIDYDKVCANLTASAVNTPLIGFGDVLKD